MNNLLLFALLLTLSVTAARSTIKFPHDEFQTSHGPLRIYFVGHGSLILEWNGKTIYVDPWSRAGDYSGCPPADIVLITHIHQDHFDTAALRAVLTPDTHVIANADVCAELRRGAAMKNGDTLLVGGIRVEAVPAYNTTPGREKFHPKGRDNGFVLTIGGKRIYIAGDTENIPEMASLSGIDCAFLPMNQPYTMTPEQVAAAALAFHPRILYPYHYGETDCSALQKLLAGAKDIELRIRAMK
ncbi:MAG TPA: MBL fold metallo-hydrolase [Bacteroidota bacterium]|nr:MBL fold metallo-hydrolase [Bacteroidota bacterium]